MRRFIYLFLSVVFLNFVTGCASNREMSDWEQYRAHKAQDELSKETK